RRRRRQAHGVAVARQRFVRRHAEEMAVRADESLDEHRRRQLLELAGLQRLELMDAEPRRVRDVLQRDGSLLSERAEIGPGSAGRRRRDHTAESKTAYAEQSNGRGQAFTTKN